MFPSLQGDAPREAGAIYMCKSTTLLQTLPANPSQVSTILLSFRKMWGARLPIGLDAVTCTHLPRKLRSEQERPN